MSKPVFFDLIRRLLIDLIGVGHQPTKALNVTNTCANGTNTTTFPRPDPICGTNQPGYFRIRQQFP